MNTLVEVINDLDCLDDDNHKCDNCQWEKERFVCSRAQCIYLDALHYLKMYKELAEDAELFAEWKEQRKKNPPLPWDKLRTMTGKPVWIEWAGTPQWGIIADIYLDMFGYEKVSFSVATIGHMRMSEQDYGLRWLAYEKERK